MPVRRLAYRPAFRSTGARRPSGTEDGPPGMTSADRPALSAGPALDALGAGLTQLARPETVLGEVRFPLSPFLGIEVIEPTDHRRPGHRAIAGVVLIRTQSRAIASWAACAASSVASMTAETIHTVRSSVSSTRSRATAGRSEQDRSDCRTSVAPSVAPTSAGDQGRHRSHHLGRAWPHRPTSPPFVVWS